MQDITSQHQTDTVLNARSDARAQGSATSDFMPYLPASSAPDLPTGVDPHRMVWAETVAPGGYTHRRLARGTRLRLTDPTGDACAHVVLYNSIELTERLNVADTMKIPWQAYLTDGHPLLSGDGRVLATVDRDRSAHHDAFCGTSTDLWNAAKYGESTPEGPFPSGLSLFAQAAVKHGLTLRDIPPAISFFQTVRVAEDGNITFLGSAGPGVSVDLIIEMPTLIFIANVPHPMDPRKDYVVGKLRIDAWEDHPTEPGDSYYDATPEAHRAYLNTADYLIAQGVH